ncbi:MAG TPA: hypothetical protein VLM40_00080, partial [Gemmata sp.]|nr:hypothetical protein [Gemmata sp.]
MRRSERRRELLALGYMGNARTRNAKYARTAITNTPAADAIPATKADPNADTHRHNRRDSDRDSRHDPAWSVSNPFAPTPGSPDGVARTPRIRLHARGSTILAAA